MRWQRNFLSVGFCLMFFSLIFLNSTFALDVGVVINESSEVTKLLNGQYSLVAEGILSINNPSVISKVYEFDFPLELDALIGINKVRLINSNYVDNYDKFSFSYNKIRGYIIEPNETINIGYRIYGLLNYNIYDLINPLNISVLDHYVNSFDFSSNVIVNLEKVQREGSIYNNDNPQTLNSSPLTDNSSRLVSAGIRNPTDFNYFIRNMKLYKTNVSDPFFTQGNLLKTYYNISVEPFDYQNVDFYDLNSNDNSVYWVSSDIIIKDDIENNVETNFLVQQNINTPSGGGSSGSKGGSGGGIYFPDQEKFDSILVKKGVDKTFIRNGEEFEVVLRVVNINNMPIYNLTLFDVIPDGYELKDVSSNVRISDKNLIFDIAQIEEFGTYVIKYKLINKQDLKGITYLKPARLEYNELEYFSEGIILINDILPEKKVFIQKEIDIIDDDFARVTIKVKNLGSVTLEDLLVVDNIDENSIVKDISKIFFERGTWKINVLKAGEEWEVSYIIERTPNIDTLPNVFGVDKSAVFGTLISSEEVVTIFAEDPKIIEKIGLGFAVTLLVFYLLF